jgi:hypothetical protein
MRIDPKGTVAGWPALLVRRTLRRLRTRLPWGLGELESAASVEAGEGRALIKALLAEGLIEAAGRNAWKVTQAVAVGTAIADRPPHRSVRAELPHTAPALDVSRQIARRDSGYVAAGP